MEAIKNAIISRLVARDPELPVYDERVEQGFQEPCFFVLQLSGGQTKEVDRRYRRTLMFDVHYFPSDSSEKKTECQRVATQLYELLEYVEWGGSLYRGHEMKHEVVDDVLHFFLSYNVHLIRQKATAAKMQHLEMEGHIRYD